ncbi:MAG: arsenate reductase (thioredoxin) [Halorhodospira halophila]|uniref:arsenate reductase (thioredoxin) n=1 Tax=Halorhodospira TaxID=85108 RepID=UPI001913C8CC|nr:MULTISPECIES: arsenate reductase (thioredoxin) [Halorhodospira]MBK5936171.1 arsenate reductase (thioredoxin) [Halorhodospira halophila]MBK5942411.1 arsenate reductase (thioredoxin) [Halorhodospira halophila]MCC3751850.1 arsenate reductase (thioredoxin) [Halorhodospira halophila]MCG5540022.1 arsenate reductase (thioredoxin) [Halorhodospira sp. M39old]MCG5544830.1 arsenate reductase (thioredoxin) [Halorhodospira sp. M38]
MTNTRTLLFLCTGNSCRSQMAEGYARTMADESWRVLSAGIEAHGQNPRAIAVMREDGVDIANQHSTVLTEDMLNQADMLVTVCGHADEHCPVVPGRVVKHHWPLPDPARAEGTDEEILNAFRAVRDDIKQRVRALLTDPISTT